MDIPHLDFLLSFLRCRSSPLPSLQIPIDIWAWFGEWKGIKSLNHLITRTSKESEKKWSELSLSEISRLMIRSWSFRQMKQLEEINLTWSMEQKSTTSKIFNKKTDLNVSFFLIWFFRGKINTFPYLTYQDDDVQKTPLWLGSR